MGRKRNLVPQAAVVAVKDNRICVVTTDGGREWVIPKGNLQGTFRHTATLEAWEEAGVLGKLSQQPLTTFTYRKCGKKYQVKVFSLHVSFVSSSWPECEDRRREWWELEKAQACLKYASMRQAVRTALQRRAA